jgi:hypothetical protein
MAKKWSDVAASAAFQALSFEEQEEARRQYFEQIIAPQVPEEDVALARDQFFADTTRSAGGGRGSINPPMAYEPQPTYPKLRPAPAPATDYSDMATAMQGTPMSRPQPAAPAPAPAKPPPYKNRLEALDDAVNLVEEGADFKKVAQAFSQIGIGEGDIMSHGKARKSPMFDLPEMSRKQIDQYVKPQPQPMPEPTGTIKAVEPTALQEIGNTFKRGALQAGQILDNLSFKAGIFDASTTAERMRERNRQMGAAAPSGDVAEGLERLQAANETGDYGTVAREVLDPSNWKALAALVAESAVASSPAIAATVGGTLVAGPFGAAGATALTSFTMEYGAAVGDVLEKRKVNLADPVAVRRTLENPEFIAETRERGLKRGVPIAAFDALSAGFAGRFVKTVERAVESGAIAAKSAPRAFTVAGLKEGGLQVGAGMAGEATGQLATGESKPLDVLIEGLAELPGGVAEVGGNLYSSRNRTPEGMIASAISGAPGYQQGDVGMRAAAEFAAPQPTISTQVQPIERPQIANFTPTDSPTKQAGLVDIVVPLPGAATAPALGDLNVGTTGVPGGLAGAGGEAGGGLIGGSMGAAGPGAAGAPGVGGGAAPIPGVNDRSAVPAGGAAGQRPTGLTKPFDRASDADLLTRTEAAISGQPTEIWTGRRGDGYVTEQDAKQALPGRQRMFQDLQWGVEQMPNGKYRLAGYSLETNLGNQTPQAQQGQTQGQRLPGPAAAGQGVGPALAAGSGAPQGAGAELGLGELATGSIAQSRRPGALATPAGAEAAGITQPLKLAPPAPLRTTGKILTRLKAEANIDAEIDTTPMTEAQQAASAIARLNGKTVTFLKAATPGELPNGFVISDISNKDIYLANDSDDAPLSVAMHEIYHLLPEAQRKSLNAQLLALFKQDRRGEFAIQFKYDPKNDALIDEEIPAFMVQAISKREDFWQELRTKMGNKEFAEVAKTIITKLSGIISGARKEYGDEFVNKYITDVEKARGLLTTAYADAMKAQGLQPDMEVAGSGQVMASNRATQERPTDVNALGMYSELARKLDAGPNQAPADQWKAYIKGLPTKGVKPDEIEWSGVNDFLELKRSAGQKVTKAEVAEYIKQGGVQVEETVLGKPDDAANALNRALQGTGYTAEADNIEGEIAYYDDEGDMLDYGDLPANVQRIVDEQSGKVQGNTKYSKYTLPGGVNYREVLLTLPMKAEPNDPQPLKIERRDDGAYVLSDKYGPVKTVPTIEEAEAYRDRRSADDKAVLMRRRENEGKLYRSSHWNQPNVLAHIRVNDRTDADGSKVLLVEELQSDWGQAGAQARKKEVKRLIAQGMSKEEANKAVPQDFGFADPKARSQLESEIRSLGINKPIQNVSLRDLADAGASQELQGRFDSEMLRGASNPTAAPFVTKTEGWLNLALKRVMIMAAEGGYDRVAFTTGAQNAERFSLDKTLREIAYEPAGDGKYEITATDLQGKEVISEDEVGLDRIEELVGKEVAEKIARDEGERDAGGYREWRYLRGDNLKVEAKGMRAFYDIIVPTALKKLLPKVGGGQMAQVGVSVEGGTPEGPLHDYYFDARSDEFIVTRADDSAETEVGRFATREEAATAVDRLNQESAGLSEQPGFDITPAMRDRIAGGVPMFSNRAQQDQTGEIAEQAAPKPRRGAERVGDFDVRTMKDGTIMVYGDPEAIRAAIPDDVKGRVTKDGYVFTNAAAPRVKAALEGRKTAYSRGGQVTEKLPMKDGKYLGAPEKYNTPGKIVALRKQLRKLTLEGQRGRYWYENSSRAILRMTGGNVQEARKFVALLAIYSPQARVDSNSTFALRAWAQYKAGQPISVKTGVQDKKATQAMADVDAFWSGEKTGNFFFNLLREIDTSTAGKQGATIDMWMMRAAEYANDAPTPTQYAFMENETNRIAQEMGWEPQQVQAAIWVAMKARMENKGVKERTEATSEKKGWIRFERDAKGKKVRVIIDAQKHRDNWLKHAMEHVPTKEDTEQAKFDFADGVGRHIGQLSFEARPGRGTGVLDGIHSAPYAQQVEFQQAVQRAFYDENGTDMLAAQLGLLTEPSDIMRPGVWQGEVSPSTQKRVAMAPAGGDAGKTNVDPAQAELLNVYASVVGLVARQEGVGWHRPFYAGTKGQSNGLDIDIGRALNPVETKDLEAAIGKWMDDKKHANWQNQFALISSPTGIRVVNFGIITNAVLQSDIVKVAESVLPNFDYRVFASSGDMPTNDWEVNPNGQGYIQGISAAGRSDVLDWARSVLAPRVQRVFEQFAEKYQWGDPGRIQFSRRAVDDGSGRAAGGSAEDRSLQASERAASQEALTPLPGAPKVPGYHGPDPRVVAVAEQYARDNGIPLSRQAEYVTVDPVRAKRIANAYEVMRHAPQDPKVKEAYENLARQTRAQYDALVQAGYKFWFMDMKRQDNKQYAASPWNQMRDLRETQSMGVFPTESGFGTGDAAPEDNVMLADTGLRWPSGSLDGQLKRVLANDLFRAVHDAFGHGMEGSGFREHGEENAWQAHVRLYTGSAVGAITSETRGQNSWLNYGPYGEKNRTAKAEDTVFAEQKTGLMPEWTWTEGRAGDAPAVSRPKVAEDKEVASLFRELQDARGLGRVRALEKVDAHPMAETIRRIDQEFMDILERLDNAGLVKINC